MKKTRILLLLFIVTMLSSGFIASAASAEVITSHDLIEILSNRVFNFSSGVGGWGTALYIGSDGRFFGVYHDSDMGVTGDNYPNGTLYYCPFEGKFTFPEYIPEGATSVHLVMENLNFQGVEIYGEGRESYGEEIRDGVHLIFSSPYGIDGGKSFTLYFPEHLKANTTEEFRSWARWTGSESKGYSEEQLGFFALCNDSNQQGFSSYTLSEIKSQVVKYLITTSIEAENKNSKLGESLENMTVSSEEVYKIWDNALNTLWAVLMNNLNTETKQALIVSEMKWIDWKDASAAKEAAKFEGGSLYPLYYYTALAERTRWRCYDLLDYFYF